MRARSEMPKTPYEIAKGPSQDGPGRSRCTHWRQTKPICRVYGLKTRIERKSKANPARQKLPLKYEARNPKSETNPKHEIGNHQNVAAGGMPVSDLGIRSFGLVSGFDPFGCAQDMHSDFDLAPMGNCAKQSQCATFLA